MLDINTINIDRLDETITISDVIGLLGGSVNDYPVIGKTIELNGNRRAEHDIRDNGNCCISYEWSEKNVLIRIYIGHKHIGPMLSCSIEDDGSHVWRNLYGNGNHGKNYTHGGTWSAATKRTYQTASEAMGDRDYDVTGIKSNRRYTEGQAAIDEIREFCNEF